MATSLEAVVGPRERACADGLGSLGNGDLLALLLGTGRPREPVTLLAERLLLLTGGLVGLGRLGPSALADLHGVGPVKALRLAAALELGQRVSLERTRARRTLSTSTDVAGWMRPRIAGLDHEEMWVIALDGRNGVRGARRVAHGGQHGCSVTARDVVRVGLLEAGSAIVICHNHPSGDPTPSPADIAMTRSVRDAADVVGLPLVDHVIVAGERHASLLDLGYLGS